ncbi:MAG: hypothetical protein ACRD0P_28295, partial [Stackebrandtia sp.]
MFIGDSGAKMAEMPPHHEPTLTLSEKADTAGKGPIKRRVRRLKTAPRRVFWTSIGVAQRSWPIKEPRWEPFGKAPKSWWPDIVCAVAFVVITVMLLYPSPLTDLDMAVRVFLHDNRNLPLDWTARVLNNLGAGRVVAPVVLLLALWCA